MRCAPGSTVSVWQARPAPCPPPGDTPHLSASPRSSRPREKRRHSQLERLASSHWRMAATGWEGVGGLRGLASASDRSELCSAIPWLCASGRSHDLSETHFPWLSKKSQFQPSRIVASPLFRGSRSHCALGRWCSLKWQSRI